LGFRYGWKNTNTTFRINPAREGSQSKAYGNRETLPWKGQKKKNTSRQTVRKREGNLDGPQREQDKRNSNSRRDTKKRKCRNWGKRLVGQNQGDAWRVAAMWTKVEKSFNAKQKNWCVGDPKN